MSIHERNIGRGKTVALQATRPAERSLVYTSRGRRKVVTPRRARSLDEKDVKKLLRLVHKDEHAERNEVLLRLSFKCGLRAKEIANVRWDRNVIDGTGDVGEVLRVTRDVAKGGVKSRTVERIIPINAETRAALQRLRELRPHDKYVIYPILPRSSNDVKCKPNTIVKYLGRFYDKNGFVGCTSHSGRRTFGTTLARRVHEVGGSIVDVQNLLGHRSLESTMHYVDTLERHDDLVGLLH